MGGVGKLVRMRSPPGASVKFTRIEAIIQSVTRQERDNPGLINGSQPRRIAGGSKTTVSEVNCILQQFEQPARG
jgi:signal recognition particle subunit SRP54